MRRLRDALLLLPLGACYALIARLNPELAPQVPVFLLFFAGFVALPAIGLGGLLVRLPLSLAERLALGSPAALAALFGLSYAAAALHQPGLVWVQPGLGLAACALAWGAPRRTTTSRPDSRLDHQSGQGMEAGWGELLLTLGALSLALGLCLPKLLGSSLPLPDMAIAYYNDDVGTSAYVFAALRAVEHGLPVWDPLVAGTTLSYHLLYHFCLAACALVTGLHPLDQVVLLWPPVLWLLLAGAVVTGCRRLAGFSLLETALTLVLTLFSGGWGFYASPGTQLYNYHHTFFMGLPALFLFATALYGHLSGRGARLFALHAAISFLVCAATKASLMLVLPVALLPVLLVRVLRRQAKASEFLLAGLCLSAVAALKLTIFLDSARVVLHTPRLGKVLLGTLSNLGDMAIVLGACVLFAVCAADANPVLRHKLSRARQYHLFCLGVVLVSAVLLKMFNFIGGDFYFYWYARVLVFLACAPALAHALAWRTPKFAPVAALLLFAGAAFLAQAQFLPTLFSADVAGIPGDNAAKVIDRGEREGLRWASTNLDRRKTFFTNKDSYLSSYMGGYEALDMYDYLAWSGLQGQAWATKWLPEPVLSTARERVGRQKAFLAAASPEQQAQALARLDDVDYYFHALRLPPKAFIPPDCLREVHRTASLVIFENTCRQTAPSASVGP